EMNPRRAAQDSRKQVNAGTDLRVIVMLYRCSHIDGWNRSRVGLVVLRSSARRPFVVNKVIMARVNDVPGSHAEGPALNLSCGICIDSDQCLSVPHRNVEHAT